MKPRILFVHTVCPSQFSDLCEHLNASGAAEAWYMTTPGNLERNRAHYRNLLPLTPDGNMMAANKYYYSGKVERAGRISLGLLRGLRSLLEERRIDLVVAHGSLGSPHFLFDELDIPVITYIEFPSYADHGWDPRYPPTEPQRLIDKNMQMLSYYEVIKSDHTLVPTEYARSMFPDYLQPRITARFEGMDPDRISRREDCGVALPDGQRTVGFAARDLSSAKGLETFIAAAVALCRQRDDIHFVVAGDASATTYGYEQLYLEQKYGKNTDVTFLEYLLRRYKADRKRFTFTGRLPYAQFSDLLHRVELFMYPVMYGSGNWGLLELLIRGRPVVASRRCYVGELIDDGVNGVLIDGDEPADWSAAVTALLADDALRHRLGDAAAERGRAYYLPTVAADYMDLFNDVIARRRAAR